MDKLCALDVREYSLRAAVYVLEIVYRAYPELDDLK
jgi:hypothetical protein